MNTCTVWLPLPAAFSKGIWMVAVRLVAACIIANLIFVYSWIKKSAFAKNTVKLQ